MADTGRVHTNQSHIIGGDTAADSQPACSFCFVHATVVKIYLHATLASQYFVH